MRWREVGVADRHSYGLVAKKLLYSQQISARHDQMAGECMSEVMKSEILNPCPLQSGMKGPSETIGMVLSAILVRKDVDAMETTR